MLWFALCLACLFLGWVVWLVAVSVVSVVGVVGAARAVGVAGASGAAAAGGVGDGVAVFFVFLCFPIPHSPQTSKPPVLGTAECAERLNDNRFWQFGNLAIQF